MTLLKILSALLEYPDQDIIDALPEIKTLLTGIELNTQQKNILTQFINHMESKSLTELQQEYVKTFDLVPEHSLHLTHHLFGDDRGRGPALIDLAEYYKEYGLQVEGNELPDYLPMILEFSSQLEDAEAQMFLSQTVKVLQQLALNLEKTESPYAPLVRIIEKLGSLAPIAA